MKSGKLAKIEVLPPESNTSSSPQPAQAQQPSLEDCFNQGFQSGAHHTSNFAQSKNAFNAHPPQGIGFDYQPIPSRGHKQAGYIAFLEWISANKSKVFISALASFTVLFAGSIIVARSSADLSQVRANSLATATGAVGASSMTIAMWMLSRGRNDA